MVMKVASIVVAPAHHVPMRHHAIPTPIVHPIFVEKVCVERTRAATAYATAVKQMPIAVDCVELVKPVPTVRRWVIATVACAQETRALPPRVPMVSSMAMNRL